MLTVSNEVVLPVGIRIDGKVYREITIDPMNGYDEENMSSKAVKNNGAKALTILLRRSIQEIKGLIPKKKNSAELIDERIVRDMFSYDRDFLFFCIRALGDTENIDLNQVVCPECDADSSYEIDITKLDVYDWADTENTELDIEFSKGFMENGQRHKLATWKFLTGRQQETLSSLEGSKVLTSSLALGLKCVVGLDYVPTEEQLRRMSSDERLDAFKQIAQQAPGLQTDIEVECQSCGHRHRVGLDVTAFFNSKEKATNKTTIVGKRMLRK
jgi:hypothetical protein